MSSLSARYVFAAPEGQTLDAAANQAAMDAVLAQIRDIDQVEDAAKVATRRTRCSRPSR